jgi:hypothetical protein
MVAIYHIHSIPEVSKRLPSIMQRWISNPLHKILPATSTVPVGKHLLYLVLLLAVDNDRRLRFDDPPRKPG